MTFVFGICPFRPSIGIFKVGSVSLLGVVIIDTLWLGAGSSLPLSDELDVCDFLGSYFGGLKVELRLGLFTSGRDTLGALTFGKLYFSPSLLLWDEEELDRFSWVSYFGGFTGWDIPTGIEKFDILFLIVSWSDELELDFLASFLLLSNDGNTVDGILTLVLSFGAFKLALFIALSQSEDDEELVVRVFFISSNLGVWILIRDSALGLTFSNFWLTFGTLTFGILTLKSSESELEESDFFLSPSHFVALLITESLLPARIVDSEVVEGFRGKSTILTGFWTLDLCWLASRTSCFSVFCFSS